MKTRSERGRAVLGGVASLLGLAFVAAGGVKLDAPADFVEMFAAWGLPPSAVAWSGWIEVALGLLFFYGPTRRFGGLGLAAWMACFIPLQLRAGQVGAAAASGAVLVVALAASVSGLRERGWTLPRAPAPLDRRPSTAVGALVRLVRLVGVAFLIRFAVGGVLFWSALPILGWLHARSAEQEPRAVRTVLLYLLVLGVGVSGVWGFVGHFFLSAEVGAAVGWDPSPFQRELAFYHLGLGGAGLACLWAGDGFKAATVLVTVVFAYGAGIVHLQDFLATGNTAPANWGSTVLFGNVLVPTVLLAVAGLALRRSREGVASNPTGAPYL